MPNVCKKCNEAVTPDPVDGHCPNCRAKAGYTVSNTLTVKYNIESFQKTTKDAMRIALDNAYSKLNKLNEKYKDNGKLSKDIQDKIKHLQKQEKTLMKIAEEHAKTDYEESKKAKRRLLLGQAS